MKRYILTTSLLAVTFTKRFFRDPVALFFTFLFPLLFLFVFGALNRNSDDISFNVALINQSKTQFAEDFVKQAKEQKTIKINEEVTTFDDARERLGRGELDSILELPADFGKVNEKGLPSGKAVVYFEESSPQGGQTFASIMQSVIDGINANLVPQEKPFAVETKSTSTANLSPFDYVFSGLLGFTILSLGIFGMANGFPVDKKAGILRRLRASPLTAAQLIMATALEYLVIGILSVIMMMVVGMMVFGFEMRGDYVSFSIFTILGIIMLFGFGLAIGGWAKNENQSAPLSNLVAFPMMFLSGTFFPRFLMPEWLQNISDYLPLSPIIDGLRYIMTEGKVLWELGPELAIIGVWTLVIYAVAIKAFRWE